MEKHISQFYSLTVKLILAEPYQVNLIIFPRISKISLQAIHKTIFYYQQVGGLIGFQYIYNIETILITNEDKNVNLINKQRTISVAPPKSNVIDTIGAGDAFFATFTAGLLKNLDPNYILSKSCEIASYDTERKGAILDLPKSLKHFQ